MQNYVNKLKDFMYRDWLDDIKNFYLNINPVYRRSFWILFIITNIVFGFYTINFLWGNHDWGSIIKGKLYNASFHEGRYGAFVISEFLTGNLYLPIISALWSYAALSLSAVLLAIYWKVPTKTSYFVIFGLILNITPYTLSWLWYAHWTVNIFFGRLLIFASFILSDKIMTSKFIKQKFLMTILVIAMLNFSLSIYPSFIGTFVMVLVGRILVEMIDWSSWKQGCVDTFKQNKFSVVNLLIAIVIYKIVLEYMKYKKIINENFYNMQTIAIAEMPEKILFSIKSAWIQFTDFATPFYPDILTKMFLILAIIFIIQVLVFSKKTFAVKASIFAVYTVSLFLTKVVAFISNSPSAIYQVRIDFCGYVLFNALIIALCLNIGGILQNIKIILSCFIIYIFSVNDFHMLRTWKLGLEAEKIEWNRVAERISSNPAFDFNNYYQCVQIGNWKAKRPYFIDKRDKMMKMESIDLLNYSHTPRWAPFVTITFYNPFNVKRSIRISDFTNPEYMSALKRIYDAGLLENAKAWPAQNSIIVYDDIILVIMDEKDLQKAKQLLAEQDKKEKVQKDKINVKAKSAENLRPQMEAK